MTINSSLSREQFIAFRDAFRTLANKRELTAYDMVAYNVIRGLPADRGFSSVTNAAKLANGADPTYGFRSAKADIKRLVKYYQPKLIDRYELTAEQLTAAFEAL